MFTIITAKARLITDIRCVWYLKTNSVNEASISRSICSIIEYFSSTQN